VVMMLYVQPALYCGYILPSVGSIEPMSSTADVHFGSWVKVAVRGP
jgi:hypothetical protein